MLWVAKKTSPSQVRIIKKPLRAWKEKDNMILILLSSFAKLCHILNYLHLNKSFNSRSCSEIVQNIFTAVNASWDCFLLDTKWINLHVFFFCNLMSFWWEFSAKQKKKLWKLFSANFCALMQNAFYVSS